MPVVATIVLNWNDAETTVKSCISVLNAFDACSGKLHQATLWVVDNGSEAEDTLALQDWCSAQDSDTVSFVANDANLGFAGGMNTGITAASSTNSDFYLLLNNDVELDILAISALISHSQTNGSAAITGLSLLEPKTGLLQSAGGYRYYPSLAYSRPLLAGKSLDQASRASTITPDYVSGAAMWLKGDFLRRSGRIPQDHFLYFEELELNQLLMENETLGWCLNALATHTGGGSLQSPKLQEFATYHAALSAFQYTRRYHPWYLPSAAIARIAGISLRAVKRRQPGLISAVLRALLACLKSGAAK